MLCAINDVGRQLVVLVPRSTDTHVAKPMAISRDEQTIFFFCTESTKIKLQVETGSMTFSWTYLSIGIKKTQ